MNTVSKIKSSQNNRLKPDSNSNIHIENKNNVNRIEKKKIPVEIALIVTAIIVCVISFTLGRYPISIPPFFKVCISKFFGIQGEWPKTVSTIIFEIRFPRIIAAFLIGGSMALSGVSYQGMFKNPMVSPDILGASAGCGLGAAVAILCSFNTLLIQLLSFLCGIVAVLLTMSVSKVISRGNNGTLILVLAGMVVSTLFSSCISITKFVADPENRLPAITFWLMGGLSMVQNRDLAILFSAIVVSAIPLFLVRWKMNVLSFGDEEALALGVNVKQMRYLIIACSTFITASCVSLCGMVGWIGLVVPHMARLLVGPNFKQLLPVSTILGGTFLLIVDDICRCAFSSEIPLGIITSVIGAPLFLYLLMKGKKGWL